jgi:hypothetical protein
MARISRVGGLAAIVILAGATLAFAQGGGAGGAGGGASAGGAASGPSAGSAGAAGTPNAGAAGAGSQSVSGVPSGPANAGALNNSANDPSGVGNASKLATPQSPGTNSVGTAQSSGGAPNAQPGVTTGSGGGSTPGANTTPQQSRQERDDTETAIHREDEAIDRKVKSICHGC